jgi:hypothetical protein
VDLHLPPVNAPKFTNAKVFYHLYVHCVAAHCATPLLKDHDVVTPSSMISPLASIAISMASPDREQLNADLSAISSATASSSSTKIFVLGFMV